MGVFQCLVKLQYGVNRGNINYCIKLIIEKEYFNGNQLIKDKYMFDFFDKNFVNDLLSDFEKVIYFFKFQ